MSKITLHAEEEQPWDEAMPLVCKLGAWVSLVKELRPFLTSKVCELKKRVYRDGIKREETR